MPHPTEEWLRNENAVAVSRAVHPLATGVLQVHRSIELFGNASGSVGFRAPATASGPIYVLPASDSSQGMAVLTTDGMGNLGWTRAGALTTFGCTFDNGSSVLAVNTQGRLRLPYAFTIKEVSIMSTPSGSVQIDLWATGFSTTAHPTRANSITAGSPPAVSSAFGMFSTTFTSWTTRFASNTAVVFNVDSVTSVTQAVIQLTVEKRDNQEGVSVGPGGTTTPFGDGGAGAVATDSGGGNTGGDYGGPWVCPT